MNWGHYTCKNCLASPHTQKCQTHPFEKRDKFVKQIGRQNINQNLQGFQNLTEISNKMQKYFFPNCLSWRNLKCNIANEFKEMVNWCVTSAWRKRKEKLLLFVPHSLSLHKFLKSTLVLCSNAFLTDVKWDYQDKLDYLSEI